MMRGLLVAAIVLAAPMSIGAQVAPLPNCGIGVPQGDTLVHLDRLAAVVGDRPILCSDIARQYMGVLAQRGRSLPDSATIARELQQLLDLFIDTEVLMHIAEIEEVRLDMERLERVLDAQIQELTNEAGGAAALTEALRAEGISSIDAYRRMREDALQRENVPQLLLNKLRSEGRLPVAPVSEAQVTEVLQEQRASFGSKPALITFRQMYLLSRPSASARLAARAKADSLLAKLQRGADFDSLARLESMDSSTAVRGGDLDWQRRNRFVPEFERWVWGLQPGQLSPVVETSFGYHIIRVDRKRPAEVRSRHILVTPAVDSSDFMRTKVLADSIVRLLRAGAPFDSLAEAHADPLTQGQRFIPSFVRDSLPPEYAEAFRGLRDGDVAEPFVLADRQRPVPWWMVAVVVTSEDARDYTEEELRDEIRTGLQQSASIRAYLDRMKKQVYIRKYLY